jgi:Putative peptidoglycan binding domain
VAELSVRRVTAIAAVAAAVVGGAVAVGVAMVASAGGQAAPSSTSSAGGGLGTAAVVRTTLTNAVQVGGSITYAGAYTISTPSGSSPLDILQAQQAVSEDRQTLSADERTASDASTADERTITTDEAAVTSASATLSADRAAEARDCAEKKTSTPACTQAAQKAAQDQTPLTQAEQQLAGTQATATLDHDQNSGKVGADQTKLRADRATLSSLEATAVNSGTTFTWLPAVGAIIRQDGPVYSVSNEPVPLLYGPVAAYRAFHVGMTDGADVRQLSADLIALGDAAGLHPSDHYSTATATAVKRWQRTLGLRATGQILLGQVVFEPGPIRVTSVTASVGASIGGGGGASTGGAGGAGGGGGGGGGGGTVLAATSAAPVVAVQLDVTEEYLVKPGDTVSVVLPNGTSTVPGRIQTVGDVATCPGGAGTGLGNSTGPSTADQFPCASSGSGTASTPTVTVTIRLQRTPPGAKLDQAPVNVNITSQTAKNVLAVPVNALLALQGGGYGVDVVTARGSHLVGVTTGLYSNTLVQVSGPNIAAGTRVQVPAS